MFSSAHVVCSVRFLNLKTEGQTTFKQKTLWKVTKMESKFLLILGLNNLAHKLYCPQTMKIFSKKFWKPATL